MSGQYEKALKDHPAMDRIVREAEAAARLQAFEEAAKIAERHLPAGMYPEALAGAIAAAIRQHAKGDGK
jgi:hypothetical protein